MRWNNGFLVDAAGRLLVTRDTTGARMDGGYLRSPDHRLVIA